MEHSKQNSTKNNTSSSVSNAGFIVITGMAVAVTAATLTYKAVGEPSPNVDYSYVSQEPVEQYQGQYNDYYSLTTETSISILQQIEVLHSFSNELLENIKEIDPDFSALVDEKFWEMF